MVTPRLNLLFTMLLGFCASRAVSQENQSAVFSWRVSADPILSVDEMRLPESEHPWVSVKDPSIVRYNNDWHLFCSLRKDRQGDGRIRIGYLRFKEWTTAKDADWTILELTTGYHGAPQVFYFEPHEKWYLVYQAEDSSRGLKYGPCFSTNDDITKPDDWTLPEPLYSVPEGTPAGLDYWVICDATTAYLFYSSLDGRMWRAKTPIEKFPDQGWTKPVVALQADIFEASHTYAIEGEQQFLTVVEAQGRGRRYYKAFMAESLEGEWKPIASSYDKPFASAQNIINQDESWTTSYSHGELIRVGYDQKLTIELDSLQFVFQGASDQEYAGQPYGQIGWQLGILEAQSHPLENRDR